MKTIKEKEIEIKTFLDTVYVDHFAIDKKSAEFTIKDNVLDWEDINKLVNFGINNGLELSMEKQEETDQEGFTESWIMFEYKLKVGIDREKIAKFVNSFYGANLRYTSNQYVEGWLFEAYYDEVDNNLDDIKINAQKLGYTFEPPKGKRIYPYGTASLLRLT